MSNWAKATDVEETALTDEMFFIWSQMEAPWDMCSSAFAQLESGASSQPTVNNFVSYTEEVFFFFLLIIMGKMQLHGIFIFQLQLKGKQNRIILSKYGRPVHILSFGS